MDKETLSSYGWIVVLVLILSVMIAMATPFGDYIGNAVKSTTQGLFDVQQKAMDAAGLEMIQQEFEDMFNSGENGETPPTEPPKDVLPVFNQPYRFVVNEDDLEMLYEFVLYEDGSASMWVEYLNGEYAGLSVGEYAPVGTYKYSGNTIIDSSNEENVPLTISADGKTISDGEITMQLTTVTIGNLQQDTVYSGDFAILGFSVSATFNADKSISVGENGVITETIPADTVQYFDNYVFIKGETAEDDMYCPIYPDGTKIAFGMFVMEIQGPKVPCPLYFDEAYIADDDSDTIIVFHEDGSFEIYGNTYPAGSLFYDETKVYFQGQLLGIVSEDGTKFTFKLGGNEMSFTLGQIPPPAPTIDKVTYTSIILNAIEGCEYSIDGQNWQNSPIFTGLQQGTEYTLYARYKAINEKPASSSSLVVISTLSIPVPTAIKQTPTSITLKTVDGCEYSIDGQNWQDSPLFEGLTDDTEYTFYIRYKAIDEISASTINFARISTLEYNNIAISKAFCINWNLFGYTDTATTLNISSTFYSSATGKWYKVTSIAENGFINCKNLESITIPDSVTSIGDYAFSGCTSLTSIDLPDSLTTIGYCAFSGCTSLTSIDLPDSLTTIGDHAFSECTSLANIDLPDSITSIGSGTFTGCTSLTSIDLPDSLTTIGNAAFYKCTSLTSIDLPDSIASIDDYAFTDCTSLTSINYAGTMDDWGNIKLGSTWRYTIKQIICSDGTITL